MEIILSIIIPTKDRYWTLLQVLDSLLSIESTNFEIVVQDNSLDNSAMIDYQNKKKDNRLKYFYSTDKLSQTGNSDLAVQNAKGEFICFIGDDDGVMPYIIDVVNWMKKREINILKCYKPSYYWPQMKTTSTSNKVSGVIKFRNFDYQVLKINSEDALKSTFKKGGTSMHSLPCLYHGIVKRTVLDKIFKIAHSYFPGPSPDMANAVALCLFDYSYHYVDFPVVLSGKSIYSIGGQGVLHNHVKKIEDVSHLPSDTAANWSKEIPAYWTGQTIWAESLFKSLERCGKKERKKEINLPFLYASLMIFHVKHKAEIFSDFNQPIYSARFFKAYTSLFFRRTKIFFKNRIKGLGIHEYSGLNSIEEAIRILSDKIDPQKLPI